MDGVHGGTRAAAQLASELAERNQVGLAYLRASDEPPIPEALARRCTHVIEGWRPGSLRSSLRPVSGVAAVLPGLFAGLPLWVAARRNARFAADVRRLVATWRPDVVQAEFSVMGQYLPHGGADAARTVVIFHEPGTAAAVERERQPGESSLFWRFEAKRWRRFERALLERIDAAVAFTARDAEFLRSLEPQAQVHVLPVGVKLAAHTPEPVGGAPRVLFVGNFAHAPNVDAARFLVDEIQPLLRERFPALELWIIGHGAPSSLKRRTRPGLSVKGYVPDLADYMARASVVVAPLRRGTGVRIKVLEAMAAGKAVVATPLAAEGIDAQPGRHLLLAEDATGFRDAVTLLLNDPGLRAAMGRAARSFIATRHTREQAAGEYEALYDRLLTPSG